MLHGCVLRRSSRALKAQTPGDYTRALVETVTSTDSVAFFAEALTLDQHVDSGKAVRRLGWQPRHGGFLDGVATYFEAWKAHQAT